MSNWIERFSALFRVGPAGAASRAATPLPPRPAAVRPAAAGTARRAPAAQPLAAPPGAAVATVPIDLRQPFFEWLLGTGAAQDTLLTAAELHLLARLDAVLASDNSRVALLPRAPAVIPQLLSSLRDPGQSANELARRVAKDAHLVAEVLRLANSAHARTIAPVTDLKQAIARLGTEGLRRVIARVVLKPIFDAPADTLSGRAAARLWLHSEAKAAECMRLAAAAGLDPFEGFLAGLMHNIGWSAALLAIDRGKEGAPTQFSRPFVAAFEPRRELFFAMLAMPWQLTDAFTALAVELLDGGLATARSPLGQALCAADRHASLELLGGSALLLPIELPVKRSIANPQRAPHRLARDAVQR